MANTGNMKNRMQEAAATTAEKAKGAAAAAAQTAGEYAATAKDKADDAVSSVGGSAQALAETIRDKGPHEGMLGTATSRVADTLASGGRYLQQEGMSGMVEDFTALIRRNPVTFLFIGIGVGCLLGLAAQRVNHGR
jgi:hypothetical protein